MAIGLCLLMISLAGYVCYQIPYQQKVPAANQTWRPAHQPVHIGGLAHTEYTLAPAPPAPIPGGQVRNATSRPQPSQQLLAVQGNASDTQYAQQVQQLGEVEQQLEQVQQLEQAEELEQAHKVLMDAFRAAESWRQQKVTVLYNNVTPEELKSGAIWIKYADPFATTRTCRHGGPPASSIYQMVSILDYLRAHRQQPWQNRSRSEYLALQVFHGIGLMANHTLSLEETHLVIAGKWLLAGGLLDGAFTNIGETASFGTLFVALKLAEPPGSIEIADLPVDLEHLQTQGLVDLHCALVRDRGLSHCSFRRNAVGIGYSKVLPPMGPEVESLAELYLAWLRPAVTKTVAVWQTLAPPDAVDLAISLACDAHTRLVHIHPFNDGNGRLSRLISALVLQRFGLPAPMFDRALQREYMTAVSDATNRWQYKPLCAMHASAVQRSLDAFSRLV